ncbi:hypothetical protein [Microbacterium mangrovi]|uniref:hypothetical protein n=1 Tax=Microbacterium mangrovi TaxID=1348253 RepID=UPI000AD2C5CE|nr:hypothetical protein [Microbacterium mangrovi]
MTNANPNFPLVPSDDDESEHATKEVDGEKVLDPDADPDLIDSAEADRLAAEEDDRDKP